MAISFVVWCPSSTTAAAAFLVVLGLHCYLWAFSSCGKSGLLFIVVLGFLIVVASLVAEHGL